MGLLRWLTLTLCCVSGFATAANYSWKITLNNTAQYFSTPDAACTAYLNSFMSYQQPLPVSNVKLTETQWRCTVSYLSAGVRYNTSNDSTRQGDSCPAEQTYNPETGACDAPIANIGEQCGTDANGEPKYTDSQGNCVLADSEMDKAAACKVASGRGTITRKVFVQFDSDGQPQAPDISAMTGCVAELALTGVDHCKLPAAKDGEISLVPNGSWCVVHVNFTGEVSNDNGSGYPAGDPAAGEEGICPDPDQCTAPEPPIVKDSTPCNYMSDGQVVGCESTAFEGNPGEMNCGTVNGGPYTCTRREPTSNGIKIATEIKTTDNGNGTATTTKTDTITQTRCIGANSCVTNVSNNKTTVVKDGNGNTLSTGTQCTGPACSSGGKGDSDGDGVKDCVTGQCEEEEGAEYAGPATPELDEAPSYGETLELFAEKIEAIPFVQAAQSVQVPAGGGCSIPAATTWFGTIQVSGFCESIPGFLGSMRYVFLAVWGFVALRVLLSA